MYKTIQVCTTGLCCWARAIKTLTRYGKVDITAEDGDDVQAVWALQEARE